MSHRTIFAMRLPSPRRPIHITTDYTDLTGNVCKSWPLQNHFPHRRHLRSPFVTGVLGIKQTKGPRISRIARMFQNVNEAFVTPATPKQYYVCPPLRSHNTAPSFRAGATRIRVIRLESLPRARRGGSFNKTSRQARASERELNSYNAICTARRLTHITTDYTD